MHHLTNLVLHTAISLLLFFTLTRMTGSLWKSAIVAGIFALHPINVETVAWVAARKNVLSTFFGVLTIWLYAGYVERPTIVGYFIRFLKPFVGGRLLQPGSFC